MPASLRGDPDEDNPGLGSGELWPSCPRDDEVLSFSLVRSSGGDSTSSNMSSSSSSSSCDIGGESGILVPTPPFILERWKKFKRLTLFYLVICLINCYNKVRSMSLLQLLSKSKI